MSRDGAVNDPDYRRLADRFADLQKDIANGILKAFLVGLFTGLMLALSGIGILYEQTVMVWAPMAIAAGLIAVTVRSQLDVRRALDE